MKHTPIKKLALALLCSLAQAQQVDSSDVRYADSIQTVSAHFSDTVDDERNSIVGSYPVTLNADDTSLPIVLKMLSVRSGYNIVTGPEVNKNQTLSINVTNTPIEEAINLVVRATGLSYEIVGNSFLVTKHENLEKEVGINSYLIELQYAKAEEVRTLLRDLSENIQVVEGQNALLVSSSPKVISEIREIVGRLDVPSQQIVLQARVIEVQIDRVKKLGIDWEKLSKLTTIIAERPFDFNLGQGVSSNDFVGTTNLGQLPSSHTFQQIDGLSNTGIFDRQLTAFDITMDFLLQTNSAKLLTDTKLTTMNNRSANIHIGEVIPFLVQSNETARVEREEVGILLEILPQINDDGMITATIKPEVSTIVELIDGTIPRKKIRRAETTVLVRDRQKIVIAGLLSTQSIANVESIPLLGDIPFFGKLFKRFNNNDSETDLIIEITPYILSNDVELATELQDSLFEEGSPIDRYFHEQGELIDSAPSPTHIAMLPSHNVLERGQYIVGFRDIALGVTPKVQIFYSPFYSIGRVQGGFKIKLSPAAALGVGYHHGTYLGEEKYDLSGRLGVFAVHNFVDRRLFNMVGEIDVQVGKIGSIGVGTGFFLGNQKRIGMAVDISQNYTPNPTVEDLCWDPRLTTAARFVIPTERDIILEGGVSIGAKNYLHDPFSTYVDDYKMIAYLNVALSGFFKEDN